MTDRSNPDGIRQPTEDLSFREVLAAILLLGGASTWVLLARGETAGHRIAAWMGGAIILLAGTWGILRQIPAMVRAIRRSTTMMAVVLISFNMLPAFSDVTIDAVTMRIQTAALLWCLAVTALLWPVERRSLELAKVPPPVEHPPPPPRTTSEKRRRRKRNRRQQRTSR